ncbi:hypothetical protein EcWSU1_02547 [Enterobacter ludwigii]|uniref:Uncharacterized protein n=1 Tax=Enterobacter ludwigii TaxID=299767 RepID=G8LEC3_9ENTR|nr:hypothetical protein EcWSU1_02547 [Enterobacter ludwigii]
MKFERSHPKSECLKPIIVSPCNLIRGRCQRRAVLSEQADYPDR